MRLPRAQRSQLCRSWVNVLSSRMARSRYFSRISSSVAGIPPTGFTPGPGSPCPCKSLPAATRHGLGHLAPARGAPSGRWRGLRLEELERLNLRVTQGRRLRGDVRVAQRFQELLGPVEVPHRDPDGPQALCNVAVRAGAADDPVLG